MAQVHAATLHDGRRVAMKIQCAAPSPSPLPPPPVPRRTLRDRAGCGSPFKSGCGGLDSCLFSNPCDKP